ncbi:MAG: Na+/H+ antiporter subunit D [Rhodothermaceae bacterium]|nr:Na+/H+ antiporter subunit D [Rhodothermaceae bacterium]
MDHLLTLPVIIPLLTGALGFLFYKNGTAQRWIGLAGTVALLIASILLLVDVWSNGIQAEQFGNWPAPFGISFVADLLSSIMITISGVMGFVVAVYAVADIDKTREKFGFYPLYHILLMGINGTFLTGDIFNMYVWFEVMLISSFVLLALGNSKAQLDGAVKYVIINLVGSAIFLMGIGFLYGLTGTLNMAELSVRLNEVDNAGLVTTVSMFFMVSFGIKAAVFPLFFWLPASYHTPPVAISAIFAGMLTKVGVYTLIRAFTLLFTQEVAYTHHIILWISGLTMLIGVLGAAAQSEVRRILSFHIISQIGYMIMGLALYTPLALIGSVFYIVHHIIVKTNLFLVGGLARKLTGSYELKKMGGLYRYYPWLTLIYAALEIDSYWIAGVALLVGLLTLFSMTKIWMAAFWTPLPGYENDTTGAGFNKISRRDMFLLVFPIVTLATLTIIIGLYPEPFYELSLKAAEDLLDPTNYINAVLGK